MPKLNDVDTSYPFLLETENRIQLLESFKGAKLHHQMQCLMCEHVWSATPLSKRQTLKKNGVSGCPRCNIVKREQKYADHRKQVVEMLRERGVEITDPLYDGRLRLNYNGRLKDEKVSVRNTNCGHEFLVTPLNLIQSNISCSVCGKQERIAPLTAWSKTNSSKWKETASEWHQYKSEVTRMTEVTYATYKHKINPTNLPRGKAGVEGAYHLDHIVPKRYCFDNKIPAEVCADYSNLQMIGWRENVGSRNHLKGSIPPLFFQYIAANSKLETYATVLNQILPNGKPFVRVGDVITTLFDEESNRAIVVILTDKTHANQKTAVITAKALVDAGIQYTLLFEDELSDTRLLSAKLKHYTVQGVSQKVHARQCEIRICSKLEKKALLDANHIQGNDNAPIAYGAYYRDQLVAVMTFTQPRRALGHKTKTEGQWELSRFCTDVSVRVPGIASKLLKHFQRNHPWTEIYSYADKRWSVGNMYYKLGFTLTGDNPPAYYYIVDGQRKHRWNYRKDVLKNTLDHYDPLATEHQNMEDHGYWRVWDCGTLKFSIHNFA